MTAQQPGSGPGTTNLGDDWSVGPDGLRERRAARVILLDDAGRVLLVRGHDVDQPERSWWFTIGGGVDPGESELDAALRELREEAGLELEAADLVGPVLTRAGIFHFYAETCRQDEVFFMARVPDGVEPNDRGWTAIERDVLDEMRWLSTDELRTQPLEFFPTALADVVDSLRDGWDGTVRHLGTEHDDEHERGTSGVRGGGDVKHDDEPSGPEELAE
ncbi:NUDIX hydrolase [Georgenia alba]|uniref:NUDIX hydrolase n=1 Tax=Georgenia alba TaxID=2233858 RepID=A0ABW2QAS3_9MICO